MAVYYLDSTLAETICRLSNKPNVDFKDPIIKNSIKSIQLNCVEQFSDTPTSCENNGGTTIKAVQENDLIVLYIDLCKKCDQEILICYESIKKAIRIATDFPNLMFEIKIKNSLCSENIV